MPTTGQRPEDDLIAMFLTVYDNCSWAGALSTKVSPERSVDRGVELLATRLIDAQRLAIEHTLIEPFVGEKSDFHQHYLRLANHLKSDKSLLLAGFAITVEAPVHVLPHRTDWDGIIADVTAWVRSERTSFPEHATVVNCPTTHHPDGRLPFRVHKTPLGDSRHQFLIVERYGEMKIGDSVAKALRGKLKKLASADADTKLLMLERDQPWVTPQQIRKELEELRPQFPQLSLIDQVWIADTATFSSARDYVNFSIRDGTPQEESFSFMHRRLESIARRGQTVYTRSQGWWFEPDRPHPEEAPPA